MIRHIRPTVRLLPFEGSNFHKLDKLGNRMDSDLLKSTATTPRFSLSGTYKAKCVSVYDGDTAQFNFRTHKDAPIYRFTTRLSGYDCPELISGTDESKAKAVVARDALRARILGKIVDLVVIKYDKYGRLLVTCIHDGENINEWMQMCYGVTYNGSGAKYPG